MARDRSTLGVPLGVDGPWLAAILACLDEIADLLTERLPGGSVDNHPNEVLLGSGSAGPANTEPNRTDTAEVEPVAATAPVKVQEPAPDTAPAGSTEPLLQPPARQGRGSSVEAWTAWAEQAGVTVADGATRNDIIAACEQAGVLHPEEK